MIGSLDEKWTTIDLNDLNPNAKVVEMQRYFIWCTKLKKVTLNPKVTTMVLAMFLEFSKTEVEIIQIPKAKIELSRLFDQISL